MKFTPTRISGAWIIQLEPRTDDRGLFARAFCEAEFAGRNLCVSWPQHNLSVTRGMGMIRGLHYQIEPASETKVVRCVAGRVWDVVVDLRRDSSTFGQWESVELDAARGRALYLPDGCAHGFQCLSDECALYYLMSSPYSPEHARGLRWDDPMLAIDWPMRDRARVGSRDSALPFFDRGPWGEPKEPSGK